MPDLSTQIETVAGEPQSVTTDGQTATEHNLKDLIEADKYLKGTEATPSGSSGWAALRTARFKPPGGGPD